MEEDQQQHGADGSSTISSSAMYKVHRRSILGSNPSEIRTLIYDLVSSLFFRRISLLVIVVNVFIIVYDYFISFRPGTKYGDFLGFLVFYSMESMMKLVAYKGAYFWDPFNVLDMVLVSLQTVSVIKSIVLREFPGIPLETERNVVFAFNVLTSLNALRIARLLRHLNTLRLQGRVIVYCFKDIIYVYLYMLVVSYIYSIFALAFFRRVEFFPSFEKAWWNLMLLMTLDDWSSSFRLGGDVHPDADISPFVFAFSFLLIQTFLLQSLLTAMLMSTYLSEVKRIREMEYGEYDSKGRHEGSNSVGDGSFASKTGLGIHADIAELGLMMDFDSDDDDPPSDSEGLIKVYEYFHRKWNQLSHLFLELTIVMNGIVYITTEIIQSS